MMKNVPHLCGTPCQTHNPSLVMGKTSDESKI